MAYIRNAVWFLIVVQALKAILGMSHINAHLLHMTIYCQSVSVVRYLHNMNNKITWHIIKNLFFTHCRSLSSNSTLKAVSTYLWLHIIMIEITFLPFQCAAEIIMKLNVCGLLLDIPIDITEATVDAIVNSFGVLLTNLMLSIANAVTVPGTIKMKHTIPSGIFVYAHYWNHGNASIKIISRIRMVKRYFFNTSFTPYEYEFTRFCILL